MARRRIYIETTIPSFYYEERPEPLMVVRREMTREWWDRYRHEDDLFTSELVFAELARGNHPNRIEKIRLLSSVPVLESTRRVAEVAKVYMARFLMPRSAGADALHMAFASCFDCTILLTWNCSHLANPRKFDHLSAINAELGLTVPKAWTPMGLLGEHEDD